MNQTRLIARSALFPVALLAGVAFAETLPANLKWESNETDPVYASPEAKRGGVFNTYLTSFPLTLRYVGPDSNDSFAGYTRAGFLSLVDRHPVTLKVMPMLANSWAYGADKKTMYFRINPKAKWSDGKPVTADDFVYTAEFMRSKEINDPFQNDYFTEEIDRVVKFDDRTLGVVAKNAKPDLDLVVSMTPVPKHYFGKIGADFVQKFNWDKNVPITGAYKLDKVDKGKLVTLKRIGDWWGNDERYFKGRFNVDEIRLKVIRNDEIAFESFKKGDVDSFWLTRPVSWHEKAKGDVWDKGYAVKVWHYNETPMGAYGFFINTDAEIFKDLNLRFAFAHAMNFQLLIDKLLYGDYERMHSFYTGYPGYTNPAVKARAFDMAKVKEYMEKSGWKRGGDGIWEKAGKKFVARVVSDSSPQIVKRLEVLKEEAKKAGIEVELQTMDGAAAFKTSLEKKHEITFLSMGGGLRPEPWQYFHSSNAKPQTNNFFNLKDPQMDKLVDAYRDSTDEKERQKLAKEVQQRISDLGIFVPAFAVPFTRETAWRWWRLPTPPGTKLSDYLFNDQVGQNSGGLFWFDPALQKETRDAMKAGKKFAPVTLIDKTYKAK